MNEAEKDSEWYRQKFLYPNGTLKNKLNITDAAELAQKRILRLRNSGRGFFEKE